jgi:hypothetical protein
MTVSCVERDQADAATLAFYDRSEERFKALPNIFEVFGHQPEYGVTFPTRRRRRKKQRSTPGRGAVLA